MRSVNKLILGLLLLYKPFFCQISRAVFYNDKLKRDVVTRYRDYALVFDSPLLSEEKIYLNIKSDSLDNGFMTFYIYVIDGKGTIFHENTSQFYKVACPSDTVHHADLIKGNEIMLK